MGAEAVADLEREKAEVAASKKVLEERELRLLEEEVEQHKITEQLREEHGRLDQQRRGMELLKKSLLQDSARRSSQVDPDAVCVEMQMDGDDARTVNACDDLEEDRADDFADEVWDVDWSALESAPAGSSAVETASVDVEAKASGSAPAEKVDHMPCVGPDSAGTSS